MESSASLSSAPTAIFGISNNCNIQLAERPVVLTPEEPVEETTTVDSQQHHPTRIRATRHSLHEERQVVYASLAYKLQRLTAKRYDDNTVSIFLNAEANTSQKQYNNIQCKFLS
ncbi:hypothetical protein RMATCC62417_11532 [Rhizopus microsporus]|nr:hypothetical protein RMATCC62417_11532 [Rhizopus microsporus]